MRTKLTLLSAILGLSILAPIQASAVDGPDYSDKYLPEIVTAKTEIATIFKNGDYLGQPFKYEAKSFSIKVTVRIHRNSLSGISFTWRGPGRASAFSPPCTVLDGMSTWAGGTISFGNTEDGSTFPYPQLSGLQKRVADGDWYVEDYVFTYELGDSRWTVLNSNTTTYCEGIYRLEYLGLWDTAGRSLTVYTSTNRLVTDYDFCKPSLCSNGLIFTRFYTQNNLTTNACSSRNALLTHYGLYDLCFKGDWSSFDFTISKSNLASNSKLELVDYKSSFDKAQKELENLKGQVTSLTSDKTSLQSQVNSLATEKTTLQTQVTSLTTDKTSLQTQFTSLTSEKSTLQTQIASLTAANVNLQNQINSTTSDRSAIQNQLNIVSSEKSVLQNQVTSLQKRVTVICKAKPKPKGC